MSFDLKKKLNESQIESASSDLNACTSGNLKLNLCEIGTKTKEISNESALSESLALPHESSFENCIANLSPSSSKSSSSSSYSNSSKSSNILAVENFSDSTQVLVDQSRKELQSFSKSTSMNSCNSSESNRSDTGLALSSSSGSSSSSSSPKPAAASNLPMITLNTFNEANDAERSTYQNEPKSLEKEVISTRKKESISFGKKLKRFLSLSTKNSKTNLNC